MAWRCSNYPRKWPYRTAFSSLLCAKAEVNRFLKSNLLETACRSARVSPDRNRSVRPRHSPASPCQRTNGARPPRCSTKYSSARMISCSGNAQLAGYWSTCPLLSRYSITATASPLNLLTNAGRPGAGSEPSNAALCDLKPESPSSCLKYINHPMHPFNRANRVGPP